MFRWRVVGQVGICSPVQSRDLTKQAGWLGLLSLLTALSPLPPNILLALLLNLLFSYYLGYGSIGGITLISLFCMRKALLEAKCNGLLSPQLRELLSVELQMVLQGLLMLFAAKSGFFLNRSSRFWVWVRHIDWQMPESGSNPVVSYPLLTGVTSLS